MSVTNPSGNSAGLPTAATMAESADKNPAADKNMAAQANMASPANTVAQSDQIKQGDQVDRKSKGAQETPAARWTFLTNHSHVLILLSRNPSMVLREVAVKVGITERAVQRIIADLEEANVIEREKVGRQNHYRILANRPLRHPIEAHRSISDLLQLLDE